MDCGEEVIIKKDDFEQLQILRFIFQLNVIGNVAAFCGCISF